ARAKLEDVIHEPDPHAEQRGDRGERESWRADLLGDQEWSAGDPVDKPEEEDRQAEGDGDRESAWPRYRPRMRAATAGHVEHAEAPRHEADERRRRGCDEERDDRRADEKERRRGHRGHDTATIAQGVPAAARSARLVERSAG